MRTKKQERVRREKLLRRAAGRCGLRLVKSRRRDPFALDFGLYALIDPDTRFILSPAGPISAYSLTEAAAWSFVRNYRAG